MIVIAVDSSKTHAYYQSTVQAHAKGAPLVLGLVIGNWVKRTFALEHGALSCWM